MVNGIIKYVPRKSKYVQFIYARLLKGKDLLSAVEQIDHSIDRLISYLADHRINARIVLSKVSSPDLRSTKYIKLERRIKKLKGNLLKKVKILEENL